MEGDGEDPYLGSRMAEAQVRGFQGDHIGTPHHLLACLKHFAGYGGAAGGRDYEESSISDEQLENVYLPPFHAGVKAGAGSLMSGYMDLNDMPGTGNRWLLHDVLRDRRHFAGFVVSDWESVQNQQHRVSPPIQKTRQREPLTLAWIWKWSATCTASRFQLL